MTSSTLSLPSPFLSAFLKASMSASLLCRSRIFCWLKRTMADMLWQLCIGTDEGQGLGRKKYAARA